MLHSVFFALMVGSPTHPPHLTRHPSTPHTPPASARPPPPPPQHHMDHAQRQCPSLPALQLPHCSTVYWKQAGIGFRARKWTARVIVSIRDVAIRLHST